MKICVKGLKEQKYSPKLFKDFLQYLQTELPISKTVNIVLTSNKGGDMTTGVRLPNEMKVLADGRLLVDVLRTLAHEWVHEYQHQKMGITEKDEVPDIGGPVENMASVLASIFLKKFQKIFPQHCEELYQKKDK